MEKKTLIAIRNRIILGCAFLAAGVLARVGIFNSDVADARPLDAKRSGGSTRAMQPTQNSLDNVLNWNMCGGVGPCSPNMEHPWEAVYSQVLFQSKRPRAITLQEICQPQMAQLNSALGPLGYTGGKYWSNENASPACDNHGNAVFWQGGSANVFTGSYTHQTQPQEPDKRGWVCGQAQTPNFLACSTHLTNQNDDLAMTAAYDFRGTLNWKNTNMGPTYGAGDFNLEPHQSNNVVGLGSGWTVYGMYQAGLYAEGGHPEIETQIDVFGKQTKIDYVWVPQYNRWCITAAGGDYADYTNGSNVDDLRTSDHYMHWAYAKFPCP